MSGVIEELQGNHKSLYGSEKERVIRDVIKRQCAPVSVAQASLYSTLYAVVKPFALL